MSSASRTGAPESADDVPAVAPGTDGADLSVASEPSAEEAPDNLSAVGVSSPAPPEPSESAEGEADGAPKEPNAAAVESTGSAAAPDAVAAAPPVEVPPEVPARARPLWRRIAEALAPVVVAVGVAIGFMSLKPAQGYRFHASSTYPGYKQDGWTGRIGSGDILFSTKYEMSPWVLIDLGATRTIHRVRVTNRADYRERAVPLVVEIEESDGSFREVGRRTQKFKKWTFDFPPEEARRVRLRVDGRVTHLHLARVFVD